MNLKRKIALSMTVPVAAGGIVVAGSGSADAQALPAAQASAATVLTGDAQPQFLGDLVAKAAEVAGGALVGGFTAKAGGALWDAATGLFAADSSSSSSDSSSSSSSGVPAANPAFRSAPSNVDAQFDATAH